MDQDHFETLTKKAQNNQLTPSEKLELIHELNLRLGRYNDLIEKALMEIPEESN